MTVKVSRRASVSIVCAAVMLGPTPRAGYAQRLLARQDAIVYDLAGGGFLGDVAGPYSLAGCPAGHRRPGYAP